MEEYRHGMDPDGRGNEIEKVGSLIEEHKYVPDIDPNKAFIFAAKNGTGADNDAFQICITSLHWLTWLKIFDKHHQVFHCDGTYKVVRNRFPAIVFSRSDISGQFHPIACALTSRETSNDYTFFFKYLIFYNT